MAAETPALVRAAFFTVLCNQKIYMAMYKKYTGASEGTDTNPEAPALHISIPSPRGEARYDFDGAIVS